MRSDVSTVQTDSVILSLQRASTALAEAKTIQHTKQIVDVAASAEIYAKRQQLGEEAVGIATSIKVEALRKLGEMLKATPRASKLFHGGSKKEPTSNNEPTLAELGLDKKTSMVAQKLADLPEEAFEQVRAGHDSISQAIAKVKADKAAAAAPAPAPTAPAAPAAPTCHEGADGADGAEFSPEADELAANEAAARADALAMEQLLDADDKLATAFAEIKRLNAELSVVKVSRDGYMNQCNDLIRRVKSLQRRLDEAKA